MKRWVTFDLDGTLMQNPFGSWIFPEIEGILAGELNAPYEAKKQLLARHESLLVSGDIVAAYDWDAIVKRLSQELGLNREFNIEELVLKHSVRPKIYLLDDTVLPALKRLKEEGYSVAAVTNGYYKYQYPVMKALGLTEWLDEIVTPERVGFAKPDVRMVDGLLQGGEIVAHVGDRLDHDVTIANRIGVTAVLINRRMQEELLALTPKERTQSEGLLVLLEKLAVQENPELEGAPLPESYIPEYVISDLSELFNCLDSEASGRTSAEGKDSI
ncbi:HAD family hydrolase [Paenibacillus radicis (ex Xue et al. 2023)]|uniref:HAD family hydrolase n=1 Tax=Paenibacillus radicis (ex Xue et al. 2023) TaxID=2972489 RepID=A0ABT1YLU2_9BACL|nr:HAD family hydrolase [Paenibacillus radicis (ex Xue et al. 2023)]MCR8632925.1 HAD family hydrolase [Paenibacillus radicis (ex Xue et al. 2023)]